MKRIAWCIGVLAAASVAGCATNRTRDEAAPPESGPMTASAQLTDAGGQLRARASVDDVGDGIRVRIEAAGLAQGAYGAHIHTTGRCDPPAFTTAGPHWNPTARQHGKDNPEGMHKGDLPNLLVGTDGQGSFEYTVPGVAVGGGVDDLLDGDGAAVVIHAQPDDYRSDPSGNSGNRIACGVLG
jgi:Cu-Zn family superoxide dismutase